MSSKRSAVALGLGAAAGAVAFYVLSRDGDNKEALLDGIEALREGVADVTARVRRAAEAAVERVTAKESDPPPPAPSPPKASPLADHEAFDEEGDDEEPPEEQDEDDALADAREAMGDATPTTRDSSPAVSPPRITYPIGGTTPTKPSEEEIDAAVDELLRGEGFIGSRELTSQLLQAADASRAPCRSPFAELGDGEGLPQQ
ncbi:unnamed protein product [Pelagomonas calceolata]|uniref:Uncharacterized protein n=1 Tax=Pelagomonas calceolata TaxID=35677 RepID=A0A8J2WWX2_9STRA|nr:unnamed protein product [Pelagomonas calceolata]